MDTVWINTVFSVIVVGAVVFIGLVIAHGQNRQRKALDEINRRYANWAREDLRLKRGKINREIKIDKPAEWLSGAFSKAYGQELSLTPDKYYPDPDTMIMLDTSGRPVFFTTVPPEIIRRMSRGARKASVLGSKHPLIPLPRTLDTLELSIINAGNLFDLELTIAWKKLTGKDTQAERLWALKNF